MDIQLFVVPKSIPSTFDMIVFLYIGGSNFGCLPFSNARAKKCVFFLNCLTVLIYGL